MELIKFSETLDCFEMNSVGEKIRVLRKTHKMTLRTLAEEIGVTHGYLSQLERGLTGYSNETLEDIARVFNVSPSLLQNPDIQVERLADISEIVSGISALPEDRQEAVIQSIRQILAAVR